MALLTNVQMSVASAPGTGTITLGSATTGAQTFAAAGATDGFIYSYRIEEGANWEVGTGTYTASGTTLARTTVLFSSAASNAKVNFGAGAIVSVVALTGDIQITSTAGASGYLVFPNGIILQWVNVTNAGADFTQSFPLAFPGLCLGCIAGVSTYTGNATSVYVVTTDGWGGTNKTTANVRTRIISNGGTVGGQASVAVTLWAWGY